MMPPSIHVLTLTIMAAATILPARAVGFDGVQIAAQGGKPMGIAMASAKAGEALAVVTHGTAVAESGAAITLGAALIVDSQGRLIPTTGGLHVASGATAVTSSAANGAILAGGDAPEFVVADALQAASGAGEFIEVLLRR
ncbi:MAG: DUF2190 family protein [Magnetococcales bacterium]|nr:DUF2190 family protein [Magnetococcales bacterium]